MIILFQQHKKIVVPWVSRETTNVKKMVFMSCICMNVRHVQIVNKKNDNCFFKGIHYVQNDLVLLKPSLL